MTRSVGAWSPRKLVANLCGVGPVLGLAFIIITPSTTEAKSVGLASLDLSMQLVRLDSHDQQGLLEAIAEDRTPSDSLRGRARWIFIHVLGKLESTCRTNLLSKDEEPGSPWLSWRALGRVASDSCTWYLGALSCTDSLCGHELVPHDRLAMLCVGRVRSSVALFPGEVATIADQGTDRVDSVAIYRGGNHVVVQARRVFSDEHPCWDAPDSFAGEESEFVILRGDSVTQAFALPAVSEAGDHDDEAGDSGTTVTGVIQASADAIQLNRRTVVWQDAPDSDPAKRKSKPRDDTIRLEYRGALGRFVRIK